jgi:MFS family permease
MGIGRFAFTPLLPMMLAEGSTDLPGASLLASANYLGYLVGALACTFQPWLWQRLGRHAGSDGPRRVRYGLVATALLTLGMAVQLQAAWPVLRFTAGVASAVVFLYTSGFCLEQLARLGVPAMGALIYVGPGLGIVVSGLLAGAMVSWQWSPHRAWLVFGGLAFVLAALVWRTVRSEPVADAPGPAAPAREQSPPRGSGEVGWLAAAYGLAGFGYIITATFLPVIARMALPGSRALDLFMLWVTGIGVLLFGSVVVYALISLNDKMPFSPPI